MPRSETCSSEHASSERFAAYLDGKLDTAEREGFQSHLTECVECRAEVAELTDLLSAHSRRRRWTIATPAAAAAAVAALLLLAGPLSREAGEDSGTLRRPAATTQREAVRAIVTVTPAPDATIEQTDLVFTWRSLGEGTLYRLTVTDEGGDPLWIGETYDRTSLLPSRVVLERGAIYLWYVDALFPDGETATGGVKRFRTTQ